MLPKLQANANQMIYNISKNPDYLFPDYSGLKFRLNTLALRTCIEIDENINSKLNST